ncbi:hypothetical protein WA158_001503 [Blastocystis sp. Blastoise]
MENSRKRVAESKTKNKSRSKNSIRRENAYIDDEGRRDAFDDSTSRRKKARKSSIGSLAQNPIKKPYIMFRNDQALKAKQEQPSTNVRDLYKKFKKMWDENPEIQKNYIKKYEDELKKQHPESRSIGNLKATVQNLQEKSSIFNNKAKPPTVIPRRLLSHYSLPIINQLATIILDYVHSQKTHHIDWSIVSSQIHKLSSIHISPHECHVLWRTLAYSPQYLLELENQYTIYTNINEEDSDFDMILYLGKDTTNDNDPHFINSTPSIPLSSAFYLPKGVSPNCNLHLAAYAYPDLYIPPTLLSTREILQKQTEEEEPIDYHLSILYYYIDR